MRLSESVFFPPEIREIPTDIAEASEQPTAVLNAIPLAEIAGGSSQVKDVEEVKGRGKGKGKKPFSQAKDPAKKAITEAEDQGADSQAKDAPPPQPEQKYDPPAEA